MDQQKRRKRRGKEPEKRINTVQYILEIAREKMEDPEVLEILKRSGKDSEWFSKNYETLRSKFEGKILAIKNNDVVSEADTVEELLDKLEEKKENVGFLLIETIPPKNLSFIL